MKSRFTVLLSCLICLATLSAGPTRAADDDNAVSLGKMQVAPKAPAADQDRADTKIQRPSINRSEFSVKAPSAGAIGGIKMAPIQLAPQPLAPAPAGGATPDASAQPAKAAPARTRSAPAQAGQGGSSGRVQNIVPIRMDPPDYPREAAIAHKTGSVTVRFTVNTDGTTSDVRVLRAQPRKLFDKAAIRAVMHWRFKPYAVDGKPQPREVEQTIVFDLNKR